MEEEDPREKRRFAELGVDRTGLEGKAGVLRKLSRRGLWQRRHVRLHNRLLVYGKRAGAVDVRIDLEAVVEARLASRHGDFVLEFRGGRLLQLRPLSRTVREGTDWVRAIGERLEHFERLRETERALEEERRDDVDEESEEDEGKEGWLQKCSGNAYVGFQWRYCRLGGPGGIFSYRKDQSSGVLGTIAVERCGLRSALEFCVRAGDREFVFRGRGPEDARAWVSALGKAARRAEKRRDRLDRATDELLAQTTRGASASASAAREARAARRLGRAWDELRDDDTKRSALARRHVERAFSPGEKLGESVEEIARAIRALHAATGFLAALAADCAPRARRPQGYPAPLAAVVLELSGLLWDRLAAPALKVVASRESGGKKRRQRKKETPTKCPECEALAEFDEKCSRWPDCCAIEALDDQEYAEFAARSVFPTVSDRLSFATWAARHELALVDAAAVLETCGGPHDFLARECADRIGAEISALRASLASRIVYGTTRSRRRSRRRNACRRRRRRLREEEDDDDAFVSDAVDDSDEPSTELRVCLLRGRRLAVRDREFFGSGGSSDPRVRFQVHNKTATSSVKRKTLDPEWHERFSLPVDQEFVDEKTCLVVRCEDWDDVSACDAMGECRVPVLQLRDLPMRRKRAWYKLRRDPHAPPRAKQRGVIFREDAVAEKEEDLGDLELVVQWRPDNKKKKKKKKKENLDDDDDGFVAQMYALCARVRARHRQLGLDAVVGGPPPPRSRKNRESRKKYLLFTTAPGDVWNVVAQHVQLGVEPQCEILALLCIEAALATVAAFCRAAARDADDRARRVCDDAAAAARDGKPAAPDDDDDDDDDLGLSGDLRLFIAACNDSVTHQERAADLVESCRVLSDDARRRADRSAEATFRATQLMVDAACVGIAELAARDLAETFRSSIRLAAAADGLFLVEKKDEETGEHGRRRPSMRVSRLPDGASVVEVVVATIADYAADLNASLDDFCYVRAIAAVQRRVVAEYLSVVFDLALDALANCEEMRRNKEVKQLLKQTSRTTFFRAANDLKISPTTDEAARGTTQQRSRLRGFGRRMHNWLQGTPEVFRRPASTRRSPLETLAADPSIGQRGFDDDSEEEDSEEECSEEDDEDEGVGGPPAPDDDDSAKRGSSSEDLVASLAETLRSDAVKAKAGFETGMPAKRAARAVAPLIFAADVLQGLPRASRRQLSGRARVGHEALRAACALLRRGHDEKAELREAARRLLLVLVEEETEEGEDETDDAYAAIAARFSACCRAKRRSQAAAESSSPASLARRLASKLWSAKKSSSDDDDDDMSEREKNEMSEVSDGSDAERDSRLCGGRHEALRAAAASRVREKYERELAAAATRRASVSASLRDPRFKSVAEFVAQLEGWVEKRSHGGGLARQLLFQRRYFRVEETTDGGGLELTWRRKFEGEKVGSLKLNSKIAVNILSSAEPVARTKETYERVDSGLSSTKKGPNVLYAREADFAKPERRRVEQAEKKNGEPFLSDDEFPDAVPNELRIALVRGTGLAAKDKWFGSATSDPRVAFSIGTERVVSSTKKRTLEPVWHETFALPLPKNGVGKLLARCEDWDEISANDEMGYVEIDLAPFAARPLRDRSWHHLRPDWERGDRRRRKKNPPPPPTGSLELVLRSRYSEERAAKAEGGGSRDLELRFDSVDALLRWANALQRVVEATAPVEEPPPPPPPPPKDEVVEEKKKKEVPAVVAAWGVVEPLAPIVEESAGDEELPPPPPRPLAGWLQKRSARHREYQRRYCTLDRRPDDDWFELSWRRYPSGPRLKVLPLRKGLLVDVAEVTEPVVLDARAGRYEPSTEVRPTDRARCVSVGKTNQFVLKATTGGDLEFRADDSDDLLRWVNSLLAALDHS